ncbi:MAG: lysophospholipase [Myxococcales bacterium]|nr:lysophospholipase [Myxococcales bacterium]
MADQQHQVATENGHLVTGDGIKLVWRWDRPEQAVGTVLIAHGFGEYLRRHTHDADAFVAAGIAVLRYDMRGHGNSGGKRGHVDRFADYISDLKTMLTLAHDKGTGPVALLAHSQGGLIATKALLAGALPVKAVVLSNPAIHTKAHVPEWKKFAAKILSRGLPGFILPTGLPATAISRDPASVRDYEDDPLIFGNGTARWGWEFMSAQREVEREKLTMTVPLLVQLSTADQIIDAEFSRSWYATAQGDDITVTDWAGFYHELYNEPPDERQKVLAELTEWTKARLTAD